MPVNIKKVVVKMLSKEGIQNFSKQMHDFWIQPELDRRYGQTGVPDDFKIWECLIKFPKDQRPIVEFNDEIGWEVERPELAPGITMEVGQTIYLHEVLNLGEILPPNVENNRVAFIYLFWAGYSYQIAFDFTPNQPDFDPQDDEFHLGETVKHHLKLKLIERVIRQAQTVQSQLRQIGLWSITSLLPYPISKIVERIENDELEEARNILVAHCNPEFIEKKLVETWKPIKVFHERLDVFQEALFAHRNKKFRAAIYTLIPQIEGVITDWLYEHLDSEPVEWKTKPKIDQFHQLMQHIPQFEYMWREALESAYTFLRNAQPMQSFNNWLDTIDPNFPGRHPITHGKYIDDMFTEENSIKLFLLLDTICQFMMFYEVRVLGRNLSEEN